MATEQEIHEIFKTIDTDNDGKISIEELFKNPLAAKSLADQTSTKFLVVQELDSDNDGSLSFEEVKNAFEIIGNLHND